jgi:uncharacterized membrane protein SpoIIM required for sporulation
MVLERLYPLRLMERNLIFALILGFSYAVIGIGVSVILFPEDPAIVSLAFISLMFYPSINILLKQEEEIEATKDTFNLKDFFSEHKNVFGVYILFFLGVLLAFSFFSIILPSLATNHIFENQISILSGSGSARSVRFNMALFIDIFQNNLSVLLLCFIAALIFGDGSIFLIIWNASVWGTIFGNLAKTAAFNVAKNPFIYFWIILVIVFPHMILEAFSYVCSATAGGVISKGLIGERFFSERFRFIIKNIILLLIFALLVLVIAVAIETFVLMNVSLYRTIIEQSFL